MKQRAEGLGRRARIFRADLTKESEAVAFVRDAADFLGGLDVLVNNAGDLVERRPLEGLDTAFWEQVLAINLTSLVWVTRAAVPWLLKAG